MQVSDFLGAIGVNTHLPYAGSSYGNGADVLAALKYLGLGLVRDSAVTARTATLPGYTRLADAGIRFDMVAPAGRDPAEVVGTVAAFAAAHPGAVAAIEGPNEIDHWPVTYHGLTGVAAGIAYDNALVAAMAADPRLSGVASYSLTGAAVNDDTAYANVHAYPGAGNQPGGIIGRVLAHHADSSKPLVLTETGYHTATGAGTAWEGVNEKTQAKLTLNLLFDAISGGVNTVYLYQLMDGFLDPSGKNVDHHLGLFDAYARPKPAAVAIHNLTTILTDTSYTLTNGTVPYHLWGMPATGTSFTLDKANGAKDIVLWAEPNVWNPATHAPVAVPAATVVVDLGRTADVRIYDPLASDHAVVQLDNARFVPVSLSDHPVIVEVLDSDSWTSATGPGGTPLSLLGTSAADALFGGTGDDVLEGKAGKDVLMGGAGNDRLIGGGGADFLVGGSGADMFVFRQPADAAPRKGGDIIADFSHAEGDRIDLSAIDADATVRGNQAFVLAGDHFTGHAGELIQTVTDAGLLIQGDVHGDRVADFQILLTGLTAPLQAGDVIL